MENKTRVTRLFKGGDGRWVFTAENVKGVQSQSILREDDKQFPMERIKKWMGESKLISWVSYGDNTWVIIANRMDSEFPVPQQEIYVGTNFPEDEIKSAWSNNWRVSFLNYCNSQWVLVTEKNATTTVGQCLSTFNEIEEAQAEIKRWWDKNKAVHSLVHGAGKWVMIGQQMDKVPGQGFTANSDWPGDKIAEYFKNGKYISSIAYDFNEDFWAIVATPLPGGQSMATTAEFPYEKIKKLENTYFYGVRE
eukprot:TRINITY_DN10774_c0_g1_i1.p1 TRINITY_DN10774_c0_g1~~TRINITY_DN10774_c0_g1_i1.p1  ORF type:complete len:250 (-),score=48.05 TRINITY_DN10774_c0_g1_i1:38-787(-)